MESISDMERSVSMSIKEIWVQLLQPTQILDARLLEFGMQINF